MDDERLRPFEVERAAGISRGELWLIRHGRVARPGYETLRKLARGVAAHPRTGQVDRDKQRAALRDFSEAAGYDQPDDPDGTSSPAAAYRAHGLKDQPARFWEEMGLTYPDLDPTDQHIVRGVLDRLTRRGGGDVTDWLFEKLLADPVT
ncbi:MAG TPA: helix-turn-helix transcriptional regulator [Terriglobales bacterium]|nr:helix-turn-helix transcriptional regulator [Terriglobales bacterium]